MSKSVLVIDTPENCLDCQFCYELDEGVEACCSISDDDEDASLMKKIDCEHGLRRLKRKVERLKRRQENLEQIESLSLYGAEDLGRIKEAIYIYEDLIDIWEN